MIGLNHAISPTITTVEALFVFTNLFDLNVKVGEI